MSGEDAQKGADGFRQRQQSGEYFGGDAESAFGTDKSAAQVVAGGFAGGGAQVDDFPVLEDDFHADDMVGGGAVGQAVGAAGVFGDVAAEAASALAGGVGGVAQPELAGVVCPGPRLMTPGSTRAVRLTVSTAMTRFMRVKTIWRPSGGVMAPPLSPVPLPRPTTATPAA